MQSLLLPRVQQNPLHPFGGVNVRWTFTITPPHPASAGMTSYKEKAAQRGGFWSFTTWVPVEACFRMI
jgi:hypothetical protein